MLPVTNRVGEGWPVLAPARMRRLLTGESADRVLHLASNLGGFAFGFQLLVAEDLSGGLFHRSLRLLCGTFDSILIHCHVLAVGGY
jgi:hypothetical protein